MRKLKWALLVLLASSVTVYRIPASGTPARGNEEVELATSARTFPLSYESLVQACLDGERFKSWRDGIARGTDLEKSTLFISGPEPALSALDDEIQKNHPPDEFVREPFEAAIVVSVAKDGKAEPRVLSQPTCHLFVGQDHASTTTLEIPSQSLRCFVRVALDSFDVKGADADVAFKVDVTPTDGLNPSTCAEVRIKRYVEFEESISLQCPFGDKSDLYRCELTFRKADTAN
jgi:hypothetical protein